MTYHLNAVSTALCVHPRTILRILTGQPNPYWAEGYDPEIDIALLAVSIGASIKSIDRLMSSEDSALSVEETARLQRCKPAEFYRKGIVPDWQVGRVKRYSLIRLAAR